MSLLPFVQNRTPGRFALPRGEERAWEGEKWANLASSWSGGQSERLSVGQPATIGPAKKTTTTSVVAKRGGGGCPGRDEEKSPSTFGTGFAIDEREKLR